jgi:hypothetical protein
MKIAITGHTKGIGKCIFDNIISDGFSRTNGFDITKPDTFIDSIKNFDVFINNTFHPTYQKEVFEKLFNIWKYEEKTIINILNLSTLLSDDLNTQHEYFKSKKIFKESIQKILLKNKNKKVRVINLFIGTMENHINYLGKNKVKYKDVIDTINFVLKTPQSIEYAFISIGCTTEYENTII